MSLFTAGSLKDVGPVERRLVAGRSCVEEVLASNVKEPGS